MIGSAPWLPRLPHPHHTTPLYGGGGAELRRGGTSALLRTTPFQGADGRVDCCKGGKS
jgi:hypothetical protein